MWDCSLLYSLLEIESIYFSLCKEIKRALTYQCSKRNSFLEMKWFNAEGEMLFSRRFYKRFVRRFRTAPLGKVRSQKNRAAIQKIVEEE